jgi:hypothetical protein
MKYLLVSDEGVYLKRKLDSREYDLLTNLKSLGLKDVQDPFKSEICRLENGDKVFAIKIKQRPTGCVKVEVNTTISKDAFHSIVCFELKTQMSQFLTVCSPGTIKDMHRLLGALEVIFARGANNLFKEVI